MRIFLSFSSNDRQVAESIAESLKGAGHRVFFDQESLPSGDSYDGRIEKAVKSSDVMVYCLSQHSIRQQSYALTELRHARSRWPSAKGRVLPVMVGDVEFSDVPAYLAAVTVLRPEGNVAAETTSAVGGMRRRRVSKWAIRSGFGGIGIVGVAVAAILIGSRPGPAVTQQRVSENAAIDLFTGVRDFRVTATFTNPADDVGFFTGLEIEFDPPVEGLAFKADLESQELELRPGVPVKVAGLISTDDDKLLSGTKWRLRVDTASVSYFSEWSPWSRSAGGSAFTEIGDDESFRVRASVGVGELFAATLASPSGVCLIGQDGGIVESTAMEGEVCAIAAFGDRIAVALSQPSAVVELSSANLGVLATHAFPRLRNGFDEPVSTTIRNLAFDGSVIWVATSGESGADSLLRLDRGSGEWVLDDSDTASADDLVMKTSASGVIAGVSSFTIPNSFYRFDPVGITEFLGHDFGAISNATDFAWTAEGRMLFRNEEDQICVGRFSDDRFQVDDKGPKVFRPWEAVNERGDWSDYRIAGELHRGMIALNKVTSQGEKRTELISFDGNSSESVVQQSGAQAVSLSMAGDVALVTFERNGEFRTVLRGAVQAD